MWGEVITPILTMLSCNPRWTFENKVICLVMLFVEKKNLALFLCHQQTVAQTHRIWACHCKNTKHKIFSHYNLPAPSCPLKIRAGAKLLPCFSFLDFISFVNIYFVSWPNYKTLTFFPSWFLHTWNPICIFLTLKLLARTASFAVLKGQQTIWVLESLTANASRS